MSKVGQFFKKMLTSKRFWVLIGFILFALLLWFLGPYVAFAGKTPLATTTGRLISLLVLTLIWAVCNTVIGGSTKPAVASPGVDGGDTVASPVANGGAKIDDDAVLVGADMEQVTAFKNHFLQAVKAAKQAGALFKFWQVRRSLPWYLMVGSPKSGKSTLLTHAALGVKNTHAPEEEGLKHISGNDECHWWLSEGEAIFMDLSGKYIRPECAHATFQQIWRSTLKLFKKHRKHCLLHGIVLTVSWQELTQQTDKQRQLHAKCIRERLLEITQQQKTLPPVYLIFTKCDLIPGFSEFFSGLSQEERNQVWGCTFPEKATRFVYPWEHFAGEYEGLVARLEEQLLWRMDLENSADRCAQVANFPLQLANAKPFVEEFINRAFYTKSNQDIPFVRGIYLTSSTQQGAPFDNISPSMQKDFSLKTLPQIHTVRQQRDYFTRHLFKQIILAEIDAVKPTARQRQQQQLLKIGVYLSAVCFIAGGGYLWYNSYQLNEAKLNELGGALEDFINMPKVPTYLQTGFGEELPVLNQLNSMLAIFPEADIPTDARFGLYQGTKLRSELEAIYLQTLHEYFLPNLLKNLEAKIAASEPNSQELYESLMAYLMLGDPKKLNPLLLEEWMASYWQKALPNAPRIQAELNLHLKNLLAHPFPAQPLDLALVEQARFNLGNLPLAERAYMELKIRASNDYQPLRFYGTLDKSISQTFRFGTKTPEIPALYTAKGFYGIYRTEINDIINVAAANNWVFDDDNSTRLSEAGSEEIKRKVQSLYENDYILTWTNFLTRSNIVAFDDIDTATKLAGILSQSNSPIKEVLQTVDRNTQLIKTQVNVNNDKLPDNKLKEVIGDRDLSFDVDASVPGVIIARNFENLAQLLDAPAEGEPSPLDTVLESLAELYQYLSQIESAADSQQAAFKAAKERFNGEGGDVFNQLQRQAQRLPQPVSRWVKQIGENSWDLILKEARNYMDEAWRTQVMPIYHQSLRNKYPLQKDSQTDASLADFGEFFSKGGVLDQYIEKYIEPFANLDQASWRWRSVEGETIGMPSGMLAELQKAQEIQRNFFPDGGKSPSAKYSLKAMNMDANVSIFELQLDGKTITYRHDPAQFVQLAWPSEPNNQTSSVLFVDLNNQRSRDIQYGIWSLFKILDRSFIKTSDTAEKYYVTFAADKRRAQFILLADSALNPFNLEVIHGFNLPERLQ